MAAEFPKERVAGADEKPEDKERLDKEFKEKTEKLTEKLKTEKALEGRTFLVREVHPRLDSQEAERVLKEEKKEGDAAAPGITQPPLNPVDATLPPMPPDEPEGE